MNRGRIVLHKRTPPANRRTATNQTARATLSNTSASWNYLSSTQKAAWDTYAEDYPTDMSGFNAYMKLNIRLLYADHPDLSQITNAPGSYSPPAQPTGFNMIYDPPNTRWTLTWSAPLSASLYVQAFKSAMIAFRDSKYPPWSLHETTRSDQGYIYISRTPYPQGLIMRARLRALNTNGEASTWTTIKEIAST